MRQRLGIEVLEDRTVPSTTDFVNSLYANFLNRFPSQTEAAPYVKLLDSGTSPQVAPGAAAVAG